MSLLRLIESYGEDSVENDSDINLITINDDCKMHIFEYLEVEDLINIAETSKQLYSIACLVFQQKYGNNKFTHLGPLDNR